MVTFTGLIEREDVANFVAAFDVALQPAVRPNASPLKLFEYLALGCAIVAPDTANIREALLDEETAVLFDPDTPGSFRVAVERVCRDTQLRDRISAEARGSIAEWGLTWENDACRVEVLMLRMKDLFVESQRTGSLSRACNSVSHRARQGRSQSNWLLF